MTIWAIVPAAGIGSRMASADSNSPPKQYRELLGKTVLAHSLQRLLAVAEIEHIFVALHAADQYWPQSDEALHSRISSVPGGAERMHSVLSALRAISTAQADDWVLVHDAVRPCVDPADIERLISELAEHPVGGLLAAAMDNTVKKADAGFNVTETIDRNSLFNALTPQMFRYELLLNALENCAENGWPVTDEASALEMNAAVPKLVIGSKLNIKITHETDLALAEKLLAG